GCSGTGTCTVSMIQARTVRATFTLQQFPLTVVKAGTGSGTVTSSPVGLNCGSTCSAPFDFGTSVTLTANAANDSSFMGWSLEGCSGTGTCTVSMTQARNVTATFTPFVPPVIGHPTDFDGDSKADILWRHSSTGQVTVWLMNGPSIATVA